MPNKKATATIRKDDDSIRQGYYWILPSGGLVSVDYSAAARLFIHGYKVRLF